MQLMYFLVEFDGHTLPAQLTEFADRELALDALRLREPFEPHGGETVLLMAESEAVLHVTHPGYFEDPFDGLRGAVRQKAEQVERMLRREPAATR